MTPREDHAGIGRCPVAHPVTGAEVALGEHVMEATERGEEARVMEEVSLRKTARERTGTTRDTMRRAKVEVDDSRRAAGTATGPGRDR